MNKETVLNISLTSFIISNSLLYENDTNSKYLYVQCHSKTYILLTLNNSP